MFFDDDENQDEMVMWLIKKKYPYKNYSYTTNNVWSLNPCVTY